MSIIDSKHFSTSPFLTDLTWISSKICNLGICAFIEDTLLCRENYSSHLNILCQIINKNFISLSYDAQQLYSLLDQYLENTNSDLVDSVIAESWRSYLNFEYTWLKPKNMILDGECESFSYDIALNLNCPGNFVVMLSKQGEELCVWDIER